jgi:hypothetical protein
LRDFPKEGWGSLRQAEKGRQMYEKSQSPLGLALMHAYVRSLPDPASLAPSPAKRREYREIAGILGTDAEGDFYAFSDWQTALRKIALAKAYWRLAEETPPASLAARKAAFLYAAGNFPEAKAIASGPPPLPADESNRMKRLLSSYCADKPSPACREIRAQILHFPARK